MPVVAPAGTGTTMVVVLQLVGVASVPLKATVLVPCDAPKFVPARLTEVPAGPDAGFTVLMIGVTVKFTLSLAKPPTVTTTATVPAVPLFGTRTTMLVAPQLVGEAAIPPIVTVLAPCVAPNPLPVIVTEMPPGPEVGFRLEMLGVTVKATPLLA